MVVEQVKLSADNSENNCDNDSLEDISEISEFFKSRSVFITGATGFVGSVLLGTLLQGCHGIKNVYVLMRKKEGVDAIKRKDQLFKEKIFQNIKRICPEVLEKVVIVQGDILEENLGISECTELEITKNVTVVFHCAAEISFDKKLRFMILQNTLGTVNVMALCRKLQKCAAFIHVSSITTCLNGFRKEELQTLQFPSKDIVEAARNGDDERLFKLAQLQKPAHPNTYTFSKAISEDYVCKEASDIPFMIVRPTFVVNCWKGICPGYFKNDLSVRVFSSILNGIFTTAFVHSKLHIDIVPADIVANTLITAAWYLNSGKSLNQPFINVVHPNCNCLASDFFNGIIQFAKEVAPKDEILMKMESFTLKEHYITYFLSALVRHYIPALIIDFIRMVGGKRPALTEIYIRFDRTLHYLKFATFSRDLGHFAYDNFEKLMESQSKKDKELFLLDARGFTIRKFFETVHTYVGKYYFERENIEKEYIMFNRLHRTRSVVKIVAISCLIGLLKVIIDVIHSVLSDSEALTIYD